MHWDRLGNSVIKYNQRGVWKRWNPEPEAEPETEPEPEPEHEPKK